MNNGTRRLLSIKNLRHRVGCSDDGFELFIKEFELQASTFMSLVGPSGCGKTTLCQLVGQLRSPNLPEDVDENYEFQFFEKTVQGVMAHDIASLQSQGHRGRKHRERLRRKEIGFCIQSGELIPELTVRQNVEIPLMLNGWSSQQRSSRLKEVLGTLLEDLYDDLIDRPASKLSGGQAQRVGMARALVHRPNLLIIDEPTASLDNDSAEMSLELVSKCASHEGTAVLMVTHDEALAYRFSDQVIRMERLRAGQGPCDGLPCGTIKDVETIRDSQSSREAISCTDDIPSRTGHELLTLPNGE